MALSSKQKRIRDRLQQIKDESSAYAVDPKKVEAEKCIGLAEEAAGLGLELLEEAK